VLGVGLAVILAFAVWLVATPDYDGGRRGFGLILLIGWGAVAVLLGAAFLWARAERR